MAADPDASIALPFTPRPKALNGELVGDVGFDPLNFSEEVRVDSLRITRMDCSLRSSSQCTSEQCESRDVAVLRSNRLRVTSPQEVPLSQVIHTRVTI